jgi:Thioredoxin-like domain/Tetratricopeptide repeat
VYTDDRVKALVTREFVPVRVHVRDHRDEWQRLSSLFGVQWTPTILIVDPDGEERHRIEGFLPADDFLSQLDLGRAHAAFNHGEFQDAEQLFRDVARSYPDTDAAAEAAYWAGVAKYKATDNPSALKETAAEVTTRYPGSSWAKKASVWQ